MSAKYDGLVFRTELEATWAAFFDLAGWRWSVNPEPVENWAPDFRVSFDCGHSECGGSHSLLIAVLPLANIEDFGNHPCKHYFIRGWNPEKISQQFMRMVALHLASTQASHIGKFLMVPVVASKMFILGLLMQTLASWHH